MFPRPLTTKLKWKPHQFSQTDLKRRGRRVKVLNSYCFDLQSYLFWCYYATNITPYRFKNTQREETGPLKGFHWIRCVQLCAVLIFMLHKHKTTSPNNQTANIYWAAFPCPGLWLTHPGAWMDQSAAFHLWWRRIIQTHTAPLMWLFMCVSPCAISTTQAVNTREKFQ